MKLRRLSFSQIAAVAERGAALASSNISLQQKAQRPDWSEAFEANLLEGILPFWINHAVDHECGGMHGWLDRSGNPIAPATKSLVSQSRVLWLFSAAFQQYPRPIYREVAEHALRFIREKMRDSQHGGYFWMTDREGRVVANKKHVYGQCFALFGMAEYSRAFNDSEAREEALQLFQLIDDKAHDDIHGSYRQAYTPDWSRLLEDDGTFGYNQTGGKHQCAHTSLLEAFTTLHSLTGDAQVAARLNELLDISLTKLVDEEHGHSYIHLGADWSRINWEYSSYGHDIKLSWLITTTARAVGREGEDKVRETTLALVEHTLRHGFNEKHGGVYWEGPAGKEATEKQKVWWVQAEALMGLLNAYELTGKARYRDAFEQQARYVLACMADPKYGEWFEYGEPVRQALRGKTTVWKEPYHQGRACLEIARRLAAKSEAATPVATTF